MLQSRKKFILSGLALLAALLLWMAVHGAGLLVQGRMEKFLARHGIGEAVIASYGQGSGSQIVFSDVRLDPDGFSTIDSIAARVRWPSFFLSDNPFSEIIIGRMVLTGEM